MELAYPPLATGVRFVCDSLASHACVVPHASEGCPNGAFGEQGDAFLQATLVHQKGDVSCSTGLKVYGEGEWKTRMHGVDKRRTWRKLHLAVDPKTHEIVAHLLTGNDTHDGDAVQPLLNQIGGDVQTFYGDGAYDQMKVYDTLKENDIWSIIPPRKNAKIQQHGNSSKEPIERDECLRQIRRDGKAAWKESIGYHKRSLAETAMSRMKSAFGDRLKNREPPNQIVEAAVRCKLLNWFVALGMPHSIWS